MATMYPITTGPTKRPATVSVSGGAATYTGDWCIEEQLLTIRYVRIPTSMSLTYMDWPSLSGTLLREHSVNETKLICIAIPRYNMRKEIGTTYTTSSDMQFQKFSVAGMAEDKFGMNYGVVSGSILGPGGAIYTSQPYMRRVPWDDSIHSEVASFTYCANVIITGLTTKGSRSGIMNANSHVTYANARYNLSIDPSMNHNFCGDSDVKYFYAPAALCYRITGSYDTSKESSTQLTDFINNIGQAITASQLFKSQPQNDDILYGQALRPVQPLSTAYTGLSSYDVSRHDYT